MHRPRRTLLLTALLLGAFSLPAAEPERPRVGLALGGGGALGLAHVGVLRVLEENRIPVDVIAGTSMGSIIAGLYAAGLSPDEIEAFLGGLNWDEVLRDETPRKELFFRRKQDDQRFLFELGVGPSGIKAGTGMAAGQKLNNLLEQATLRVAGIHDFDRLPIPFRAVATDLEAGKPHVIRGGRLAAAMRASMAVPGVFTAVTLDGRVLVDGGVVNNLPVDVVRSMGAQVVIAVDVGASADRIRPEDLRTLQGILGRTYAVAQRPGQIEALKRADVGIQPELDGFSAGQFARVAEFVPRGEAAARAAADALRPLALGEAEYAAHLARRRRPEPAGLPVDRVEVSGNRRVDTGVIRGRIRAQPGRPHDVGVVAADLRRVYGIGEFEQVLVQYEPGAPGENTLRFAATESPAGPAYLKFGLNLRTNFGEDSEWGMLLNLTRMSLNRLGGEWRTDVRIGTEQRLLTEWYQPLDRGGLLFLSPALELEDARQDIFEGDGRVAEYNLDTRLARLDLGIQARHFAELRLGAFRGRGKATVSKGASDLPELDEDLGGFRALFTADRQDRTLFTRDGSFVQAEGILSREELGAARDFGKVSLVLRDTRSFGPHTVTVGARGGGGDSERVPEYAKYTLGGPFTFRGLAEDQFRGSHFGVGSLGYRYRLATLPTALGRGVYLTANLDYGNTWEDRDDVSFSSAILGGALGVGADTAAGPLYLGYGRAEGGFDQFYLSLGTLF